MADLWSDQVRLQLMFEIEVLATRAMAKAGRIPNECYEALRSISLKDISPERVAELEKLTRHETVALLTHIEELAGPAGDQFLHLGMTSSDVLDTCLSLQLTYAANVITASIYQLCEALKEQAYQHKMTICAGRSHGMHAEPTSFGLKMAFAYAEMQRNQARMAAAQEDIAVSAISGPVGTFSSINPVVEAEICNAFDLSPEPISTQVIPRDRHAAYFSTLGVIASSLERLAIEIRSLQRTEIGEIEESFSQGQKGSSAMPHKKNPILAENVTGLARLIRTQVLAALENVALWHERDMSHSSVERLIAPDMTSALDFALHRMTGIIKNMKVDKVRMKENLKLTKGQHHSHRVLTKLVEAGSTRREAHQIVQRNAARVDHENLSFSTALESDSDVMKFLSKEDLRSLFDDQHYLQNVDIIFDRVFISESS